MRFNLIIAILWIFSLSFSSVYSQDLCVGFSSGDVIHLEYCRVSTKQKCFEDNNKSLDYNNTEVMMSGNDFFDYIENNQSCKDIKIQTARNAEESLSLQWGNWIYSTNLSNGDNAYIYKEIWDDNYSVNIYKSPDFKSEIELIAKKYQKVKILKKSEEKTYKEMNSFWFQIKIEDKIGWIWGEYLHPNPFLEDEFYKALTEQE